MKIALLIYPRVWKHLNRIFKEAQVLVDNKIVDEVIITSILFDPSLAEEELIYPNVKIERINVWSNFLPKTSIGDGIRFLEYMCRIFFKYKVLKPFLVIPHRLSVLPLGSIFKRSCNSHIIYSPHELETESIGLVGMRRFIMRFLEKSFIHSSEKVIVVGEYIANWYRKTYSLNNVHVVRNIPDIKYNLKEKSNLLKVKFAIPKDDILFINQGALKQYRNVDLLLDVFKELPSNYHIVFMGHGGMVPEIIKISNQYSNIHYKETVDAEDIFKWTSSADIGIHLGVNDCLSYVYANPNKIFEFLCSHLPIFINKNKPEMKNLIDKYNCGWGSGIDKKEIIYTIKSVTLDKLNEKKQGAVNSTVNLNWTTESKVLFNIFKNYSEEYIDEKIQKSTSTSSTH